MTLPDVAPTEPLLPASLLTMARRHIAPKTLRFLAYNTYLLQGFELSLCNLVILGRIVEKMGLDPKSVVGLSGITPAEIVKTLKISKNQLVHALGKDLNDLKSTFGDVVDGLTSAIGLGDIGIGDILSKVSMHDLLDRFNVTVDQLLDAFPEADPITILSKFCKKTVTFLASQNGFFAGALDTKIYIQGKPERETRAKEIGQTVVPDYDLVALCEVFEASSRSSIIEEASKRRALVDPAVGPDDTGELASSGLLVLALDQHIVERQHMTFANKGNPLSDADAWSNKGVLRTVIDVVFGKLEIYSTHLMSGGGIPVEEAIMGPNPTYTASVEADVLATQKAQLTELLDYIQDTHQTANVAIVVGDFNLNGRNQETFLELFSSFIGIQVSAKSRPFHDWWHVQRGDNWEGRDTGGYTNVSGADSGVDVLNARMMENCPHPAVARANCFPPLVFCQDPTVNGKHGQRIDFIWVEKPSEEHTFNVDLTRIRRIPFGRAHGTGGMKFLSDHMGIDVTLVISLR